MQTFFKKVMFYLVQLKASWKAWLTHPITIGLFLLSFNLLPESLFEAEKIKTMRSNEAYEKQNAQKMEDSRITAKSFDDASEIKVIMDNNGLIEELVITTKEDKKVLMKLNSFVLDTFYKQALERNKDKVLTVSKAYYSSAPKSITYYLLYIATNLLPLLGVLVIGIYIMTKKVLHSNKKDVPWVAPQDIKGDIQTLIGMEDIKKEVKQVVDFFKNRAEYAKHGIEKNMNVMFSGPAGTGKSKLAAYLAKELNLPLYHIAGSSLETGYIGGGSSTLESVYKAACSKKKAVIFLDEAQNLFMKRKGKHSKWEDDTANTFLSILDGVKTNTDADIVWVVASNFDQHNLEMDEAMLRRFQMKVNFRLPNKSERKSILQHYLSKKEKECFNPSITIDLEGLSELTANLAPAILETICEKASYLAIERKEKISTKIMFDAFERVTVGLTDRATSQSLDKLRKTISVHELGHFIVQYDIALKEIGEYNKQELLKKIPVLKISTESISSVGALGYVLNKQEDSQLKTKQELEQTVMSLYGGVAAEEVFFGKNNITTGSSNDIAKATKIINTMVNELDMYSAYKLNLSAVGLDSIKKIDKMQELSQSLYEKTLSIIIDNKSLIGHLTQGLLEEYVLSLEEIIDRIDSFNAREVASK